MPEQKITKGKAKQSAPIQVKKAHPRASAMVLAEITHDMIAKRAREIWERKGRPDGQSDQNWLEAGAELRTACKVAGKSQ